MQDFSFFIDGREIPFEPGQTIMEAATAAGIYIPHLCYHPEFRPHGSCKLCTVKVNGKMATACSMPASVSGGVYHLIRFPSQISTGTAPLTSGSYPARSVP